jgi:hypothetical protein
LTACGFQPVERPPAPRPTAPLSTATVSTARPTLRFALPIGAVAPVVEVCDRRDCRGARINATVDAGGGFAVPDAPLARGVWWWRVRASTKKGVGESPVWQLSVAPIDGARETHWGSALDLDGDGFDELAVSAPGSTVGGQLATGRVYVYAGGPHGPDPARVRVLEAPQPGTQLGRALATVDFDGDGFADLAVSAPSASSGRTGAIYVYRGGPGGVATTPSFTLTYDVGGDIGFSLASAGDVNGDGYGDLIAGAPLTAVGGVRAGGALVFFGGPVRNDTVAPLLTGDGDLAQVGWAVAGGADFDGDGFDDVVVGAPHAPRGTDGQGRAYLYFGQTYGVVDKPLVLDEGLPALAQLGFALALLGNRDGDGRIQLAVSAPGDGPGRVYLYGGGARTATRLARLDGPDGDGARFAEALAAGDFDGDGRTDLFAGSVCPTSAASCSGRIYAVLGGATSVGFHVDGPEPLGTFGASLALGDHDADGRADLAVGAPAQSGDLGSVGWLRGSATPPTSATRTFNGSDPTGRFGDAVR